MAPRAIIAAFLLFFISVEAQPLGLFHRENNKFTIGHGFNGQIKLPSITQGIGHIAEGIHDVIDTTRDTIKKVLKPVYTIDLNGNREISIHKEDHGENSNNNNNNNNNHNFPIIDLTENEIR